MLRWGMVRVEADNPGHEGGNPGTGGGQPEDPGDRQLPQQHAGKRRPHKIAHPHDGLVGASQPIQALAGTLRNVANEGGAGGHAGYVADGAENTDGDKPWESGPHRGVDGDETHHGDSGNNVGDHTDAFAPVPVDDVSAHGRHNDGGEQNTGGDQASRGGIPGAVQHQPRPHHIRDGVAER